ncbi:TatD family deoxyribonuclease [Psychromonas sp. psych-6C06]|uniref:TatD family hydrolase n=1 Tax=Psychromonas sp. psych-6C06 TaxID=2058089 RepID=UPI000C33A955|nr:TatD family hydrolase [Psychromonas sp. psych-6C06]PKF62736.1 TatD family deoxyribonuclease [Psychromonas sp. psych-6C06]
MFVDSHCHLDFPCFSEDFTSLIAALEQKKIKKVIIPATQVSHWERIEILAQQHASIYYSLGIHPHFLSDLGANDLTLLSKKLSSGDNKCIALGEIGLDKFASATTQQQEAVFVAQLLIAERLGLPIILHCVKRQGRVLALLKKHNFTQGGVYHAFSGSLEVADAFIALGFKLGVGGVITHPQAKQVRQTVTQLPLDALILETDAPDMPIYQQQSAINNPLNIISIFNELCLLRSEPKAQLATQLYTNVHNIFPLSDD